MMEEEWLTCADPEPMLEFLGGKVSDRKWRLFACACCREHEGFGEDAELQEAVTLAERYADGTLPRASYPHYNTFMHHSLITGVATGMGTAGTDWRAARRCALNASYGNPHEAAIQCSLLRCIVGDPFQTVANGSVWQKPSVVVLAQAIYDDRAFDHLPILADAFEEAGCDNADILAHSRSSGPHARGCWALDPISGRT